MPSILDNLIDEQNSTSLRPAAPPQIAQQQGGGGVTVVSPSPLLEGSFGASGTDWSQANWNRDYGQERRDLNLDVLRTTAAQRRFQFEEAQRREPLQDALTRAQIAHQEAAARFQDTHARTLLERDTVGFNAMNDFANELFAPGAPEIGSKDFPAHFKRTSAKHSLVYTTAGGRAFANAIGGTHDTASNVQTVMGDVPEDYTADKIRIGPRGTAVEAVSNKKLQEEEFKKTTGLTHAQVKAARSVQVGDYEDGVFKRKNTGGSVRIVSADNKTESIIPAEVYEKAGFGYSPDVAKERKAAAGVSGSAEAAPTLNYTPQVMKTPEDAMKLAPGTYFLTPDGKLKRRP
jgi:hypothetical protein